MAELTSHDLDSLRDQLACAVEDEKADPDGWAVAYSRDVGRLFTAHLEFRAERDRLRAALHDAMMSCGRCLGTGTKRNFRLGVPEEECWSCAALRAVLGLPAGGRKKRGRP